MDEIRSSVQASLFTRPGEDGWKYVGPRYRIALYEKGRTRIDRAGQVRRFGFTAEEIDKVHAKKGELNFAELAMCKLRHYTMGVVIGSKSFVPEHIAPLTEARKLKRLREPSAVPDLGGVHVFQTRGA